VIYSSVHGNDGNLWCSSNAGLIRLNPQHFNFHVFDRHDGLQSNEFNRQQYLSFNDGKLLFGGLYGVNSFYPDKISINPYTTRTVITGFSILDKDAGLYSPHAVFDSSFIYQTQTQFPWEKNVFSISLAALEFSAPEKNKIRYRLKGFDETWVETGKDRVATYTNLDPGTYHFEAVSANNDGNWSNQKASLSITIIPPWWKKTSVHVVAFLMLTALLGSLIWYMLQRKHQKELKELEYKHKLDEEKLRISRDMHDSLGARLTQIKLMSEMAYQQPEPARIALMESISTTASEVITQCSQMVWSLNPANDSLDSLVDYLVHYATDFITKSGQRCRIDVGEDFPQLPLHSQVRNHIVMSVQEALHNAVKYAGSNEIIFQIIFNPLTKQLLIAIKDDGIGFDESRLKRVGNGLKNMRKRIELIGGITEIQSKMGKGTNVIFSLKLANEY
jgi:signal transduction histidine kinase